MNEKEALLYHDAAGLWLIFAALACILPIYYGFKKSTKAGMINTSIVAGALILYFAIPGAKAIIITGFILFVVVGVIINVKDAVF